MIQHWSYNKYSAHQYFGIGGFGLIESFIGAHDTTAPVLSSATGTATGSTTASGTVSTDEGNGTLYYYASINATETAATIKASGSSQAVTAAGVQNVTITGLTAETGYYLHYVQDDNALNESNVVHSSLFTTTAAESVSTGGWWSAYDYEYRWRQAKREELERLEAEAEKIQDKIDREIAKEFRKQERETQRITELKRLSKLADEYRDELKQSMSQKALFAAEDAMTRQTYSAMERFEREVAKAREEEIFLLHATSIILNS